MRSHLFVLSAVALAIGLIAAGCGGGGDDGGDASTTAATTSTTADATAKTQFVAKVDAICTKGGSKGGAEFKAFLSENGIATGTEPTKAQWAEIGEEILIPTLEQQAEEIKAISPPAGDEAEITAFVDAVDEAIEELEENPSAAKSPPTVLAKADKLAKEYGFKVCGNR